MTESTNHHPPESAGAEPADTGPAGTAGVELDVEIDLDTLVVDCDRCAVRGDACHDCVVSVLLGPPVALAWDADERRAVDALAEAGMVPRLRLVSEPERKPA